MDDGIEGWFLLAVISTALALTIMALIFMDF